MPNLVALNLMVSDKKILKTFFPWQPEFSLKSNSLKKFWWGPCRTSFLKFHKNLKRSFKEDVWKKIMHGLTDRCKHARRTPGHDISPLAVGQRSWKPKCELTIYMYIHRSYKLTQTTTWSGKLNLFPHKPWFSCVCCTSLLKTSWEKEKLLGELSAIFNKYKIVVSTLFQVRRV